MRTINEPYREFEIAYPIEHIAPINEILFIDIETTGFTAKSSYLYLIGVAYYANGSWNIKQWFASSYEEEKDVLHAFVDFSKDYTHLIHFNGNNFDIPYLDQKCKQHGIEMDFSRFDGTDIYKRVSVCKNFLRLENCKQKTVEKFLGIDRQDVYNGGELIGIYHNYVKAPTDYAAQLLLLHNSDDMKGMLASLPILAYSDLFQMPMRAKKVQANYYDDMNHMVKQELLITLKLAVCLPKPVSCMKNLCFFKAQDDTATLRVPLYEEEMKYFYANYRNYYYLPAEDQAVHKSVAVYADKNNRVQAKASNCYTRKFAYYLPQWSIEFEPFFKRDYEDKMLFFELTEDMKKDREAFGRYAEHVLGMMGK